MRLLRNRLVDLLEENRAHRLAFPEQLSMTRNLRKVASSIRNAEFLSMWAGQGVTLTRAMPAAELVALLVAETQSLLSGNHASTPVAYSQTTDLAPLIVRGARPCSLSKPLAFTWSTKCPLSRKHS